MEENKQRRKAPDETSTVPAERKAPGIAKYNLETGEVSLAVLVQKSFDFKKQNCYKLCSGFRPFLDRVSRSLKLTR